MNSIVLTPSALIDLLRQIDELKDYDIDVTEQSNESLTLSIGTSTYMIDSSNAETIGVSEDTVEQILEINDETLNDMSQIGELELSTVESGIIKEIGKTLLVGGLVRLASKILK